MAESKEPIVKCEVWRSSKLGSDAHGHLIVYRDDTVGFVSDDGAHDWEAPKSSLTIKSPWYSLGASVRIDGVGDESRIYMFHPPDHSAAVGNAIDAASGRKAGKKFKAALSS
jgi:hypothetical protein